MAFYFQWNFVLSKPSIDFYHLSILTIFYLNKIFVSEILMVESFRFRSLEAAFHLKFHLTYSILQVNCQNRYEVWKDQNQCFLILSPQNHYNRYFKTIFQILYFQSKFKFPFMTIIGLYYYFYISMEANFSFYYLMSKTRYSSYLK